MYASKPGRLSTDVDGQIRNLDPDRSISQDPMLRIGSSSDRLAGRTSQVLPSLQRVDLTAKPQDVRLGGITASRTE